MTSDQELEFAISCSPLGWPTQRWREARQQIADLINAQAKECADKGAHIEQQAKEIRRLTDRIDSYATLIENNDAELALLRHKNETLHEFRLEIERLRVKEQQQAKEIEAIRRKLSLLSEIDWLPERARKLIREALTGQ